ncbi:MAG: SDR family NAD(P)-dependent oxidoreductase [Acidobacteriota bacterium]
MVRAFAREGAHIGLLARGRDGLEGARRDVEDLGGKALLIPVDVADPEQIEQAAKAVEREFDLIDIWINNAMVSVLLPVKKMTYNAVKAKK